MPNYPASQDVNINIRGAEGWVEIVVSQQGKDSSVLSLPPDEAITYATNIIRIANTVRKNNAKDSD